MKKILFVDDEAIFLFINTKVVERLNIVCEIQTAESGRDALEILRKNISLGIAFPDVIFVDINMPGMDGFKFIDEVRQLSNAAISNVTIAMLTSSINNADKDKAAELSIEHFITKPLTEDDALNILIDKA